MFPFPVFRSRLAILLRIAAIAGLVLLLLSLFVPALGVFGFTDAAFQSSPPDTSPPDTSPPSLPHDDFDNAMVVGALPFSHYFNMVGATREFNEPYPSCTYYELQSTVWYAFTPSADGSYSARIPDSTFYPFAAAYSGDTLGGLIELACRSGGNMVTIQASAGTTYYFQVGSRYPWDTLGPIRFTLDVAPLPEAYFGYYPDQPSMFSEVEFWGNSYDPAGIGIETYQWDFGDGTTDSGSGCCPRHRFPGDGVYAVELTVVTYDGRTDSTTEEVTVMTHDVAVTKFKTPQSVSAGQTRPIVVGIRNHRYDELVTVRLYRSTTYGYEYVGYLNQFIPVRSGNRTTDVHFSYTFSEEDQALGKVTFRTEVDIRDYPDALPADNEAISAPIRVR